MKGGAWNHRRSYISRWIYQITSLYSLTTDMSKPQRNEASYKEAQHEEDALEEAMKAENVAMPSMEKMSDVLNRMQLESKEENSTIRGEDDDLEDLLEEKTPVLPSFDVFETPKEKQIAADGTHEQEEENYAESFASQRETSQLREEIEMMSEEMKSLKTTISSLLKEREALPGHLSTIREDINQQMTLMLSKLHSALESDVSTSNVKAASAAIADVKDRSSDRLLAAEDYAKDKPRENSPLANKGSDLKGKRRFRPVK